MTFEEQRRLGEEFSKRELMEAWLRLGEIWSRDIDGFGNWDWHEAAYEERLRAGLPDDGGEIGREFYAMAMIRKLLGDKDDG